MSSLSQRTTSSYPISIGTALALETLYEGSEPVYDPSRVVPEHIEVGHYDSLWVNTATLYRNIIGSIPSAQVDLLMAGDVLDVLLSEMELINELTSHSSLGKTSVVHYWCEYDKMPDRHPHALLRVDSTPRQQFISEMKRACLVELSRHYRDNPTYKRYNHGIAASERTKTLILTHDAYDLFAYKQFDTLDLLESHTGKLKKRVNWHTKYSGSQDLSRIPFEICFMQIFGDSLHFSPFPGVIRKRILEMANERLFTPLTTKERIEYGLKNMTDKALGDVVLEMLKESY